MGVRECARVYTADHLANGTYPLPNKYTGHRPCPPRPKVPSGQSTAVPLVDPAGQAYPGSHTPGHSPSTGRPVGEYVPPGHAASTVAVNPWCGSSSAASLQNSTVRLPAHHGTNNEG
jgi:hypothetical protein